MQPLWLTSLTAGLKVCITCMADWCDCFALTFGQVLFIKIQIIYNYISLLSPRQEVNRHGAGAVAENFTF